MSQESTSYLEIECPCGKEYTILTPEVSTGPAKLVCRVCSRQLEVNWKSPKEMKDERSSGSDS